MTTEVKYELQAYHSIIGWTTIRTSENLEELRSKWSIRKLNPEKLPLRVVTKDESFEIFEKSHERIVAGEFGELVSFFSDTLDLDDVS